jgi:hypothetical protein
MTKKKQVYSSQTSAFVDEQRRPMHRVAAEALEQCGPSAMLVPISVFDGSVLGTNGIFQATRDKLKINRWSETYSGCGYAIVPSLSCFMAVWFPKSLLSNKDYMLSEAILRAPRVITHYKIYNPDSTSVETKLQGATFLVAVSDKEASEVEGKVFSGGYIEGVPNSGGIILSGNKPVPVGGMTYGREVKGAGQFLGNVLVSTTWGVRGKWSLEN